MLTAMPVGETGVIDIQNQLPIQETSGKANLEQRPHDGDFQGAISRASNSSLNASNLDTAACSLIPHPLFTVRFRPFTMMPWQFRRWLSSVAPTWANQASLIG